MAAAHRASPPAQRRARGRRAKPVEYNILLTATLCLLAAGAVMVYSASSARTLLEGQGDGSAYLVKYVIFAALGLVVLGVLSRGGLEMVRRLTPVLLGFSFVLLLLVKVPGIGIEVNGARRWLGAGTWQFQPAELAKIALVLYAAGLLAQRPERLRTWQEIFSPLLVVAGMASLLIASQPDLGTALVIGFTMGALLFAAGAPLKPLGQITGVVAVLILLFIVIEPYRAARLTAFIDPWEHAHGIGFQAVQGQIALGSGGLFGVGLGESVQKVYYLPEAHTDFILAVIGEEIGVAGVIGLLFLYGLIGYAGLRTAKAARGRYAQLVAAGLTSLILCQALLNIFAVLGLAPLTGVPLPFISSGSSSLLVLLAAIGVLLDVSTGASSHLRAVTEARAPRRDARGSPRGHGAHRGGGNSGARRAGAGGGRRTARGGH